MNNKGADQTLRMRRLICAFVVRILHKQVFSWCDSYNVYIVLGRKAVWRSEGQLSRQKCCSRVGSPRWSIHTTSGCWWDLVGLLCMSRNVTKQRKWHGCPAKILISFLIRFFLSTLCIVHVDGKDWSDCMDVQADLSLCWAHLSFCRFCHALAHIIFQENQFGMNGKKKSVINQKIKQCSQCFYHSL